jgi:hypothetical protein
LCKILGTPRRNGLVRLWRNQGKVQQARELLGRGSTRVI